MSVLNALVHKSARRNEVAAARHRSFIVAHLVTPVLALLAVPLHRYLNGSFDPVVLYSLGWMMTPALISLFLWRTGALAVAHLMSAAVLSVLVGYVAIYTGGLASFAVFWLLALPVEAALSGSRRVVLSSVLLSLSILAILTVISYLGMLPPSRIAEADAPLVALAGLVSALLYIGVLAGAIERIADKTDRAIESTSERFQLLAENASDIITRHGPNGEVSFVSGAAGRLIGGDPNALLGNGFLNLIHPEDRHVYLTAFVRASDMRQATTCEFRVADRLPDDAVKPEYKWVELNCRPIAGVEDAGSKSDLVAVSRDITDRRKQREELRSARDAAEDASRSKTVFLANISHELRTPLNSVIGFAELMERELPAASDASRYAEYARLVRESGEHLLGVVNDLLDMSKIEAGQFSLCREPTDLNEVVEYCRHAISSSASGQDVSITLDLKDGGVDVFADPRACKQIVLNLLSNAVKFAPPGTGVSLRTDIGPKEALLVVEDVGPGIAPELMAKLGQPFLQAEGSYARRNDGTGLGLSIVHGLVKLHDARIDIDSEPGRGTIVTVAFPRDEERSGDQQHHLNENAPDRVLEPAE